MNILRVLSSLIHPLSFYAFTAGGNGEIIKKEAERLGAESTFIEVEGDTRTTINIIDKKNNRETEIKEKGPFITSENTNLLLSHLTANINEKDILILSGSLPGSAAPTAVLSPPQRTVATQALRLTHR